MKFLAVLPQGRVAEIIEASDFNAALTMVGLRSGRIDFGTIIRRPDNTGIAYAVYEFGLFVPPDQQHYFSFGSQLVAGNAIMFAFNEHGDEVDMTERVEITWYANVEEIELAIAAGKIERPMTVMNGAVLWQWPEPRVIPR